MMMKVFISKIGKNILQLEIIFFFGITRIYREGSIRNNYCLYTTLCHNINCGLWFWWNLQQVNCVIIPHLHDLPVLRIVAYLKTFSALRFPEFYILILDRFWWNLAQYIQYHVHVEIHCSFDFDAGSRSSKTSLTPSPITNLRLPSPSRPTTSPSKRTFSKTVPTPSRQAAPAGNSVVLADRTPLRVPNCPLVPECRLLPRLCLRPPSTKNLLSAPTAKGEFNGRVRWILTSFIIHREFSPFVGNFSICGKIRGAREEKGIKKKRQFTHKL